MLMFDRKIQKNCGSVRVTTSEFVLSVSKSIDLCKLKVDPEWGQRNLFSKRLLGSQNTAYVGEPVRDDVSPSHVCIG
jgi:hypothetical protein